MGNMMNFRKRIAIDLGTTSVLVFSRKDGVIVNEPSVVAVDKFTNTVIAVGEEASKMLGRTPGNIVAVRPLKEGVINDYESTEQMLKYFIKNAVGKTLIRPNVIICVPSGATQVQKRAVKQAGLKAGANEVYLIEEPLAKKNRRRYRRWRIKRKSYYRYWWWDYRYCSYFKRRNCSFRLHKICWRFL